MRPLANRDAHTEGFALTQACLHGRYEVAEILLQHGADPNAKSPLLTNESLECLFAMPCIVMIIRC
ncbi:MAG: ankyrin repeat domain-containing protein [Saprospiraceae bacterium]|nr:ankyrin repeat domain-containing protein [Saprospiraceae bacterium]